MIRVHVDLVTHQTGSRGATLYALEIVNDKRGDAATGHYDVTLRSPVSSASDGVVRRARVEQWPRLERDALQLVIAALAALGAKGQGRED